MSCGTSANLSPACQLGLGFWCPAQPSTAQPSPQPSPSFGVGLAKALPKAFSYSAQRFLLLDSDVPFSSPAQHSPASPPKPWCGPCQSFAKGFFLPDLARVRPPCRCVSLVGLDCRSAQPKALTPAQVSPQPRPAQPRPGQPSPAHRSPAHGPCRTLCKGFSYRIQRSHFRPRDGSVFLVPSPAQHSPAQPTAQPKPWCGPCQSSAKGFFLFCRTVFQPSPAQPS